MCGRSNSGAMCRRRCVAARRGCLQPAASPGSMPMQPPEPMAQADEAAQQAVAIEVLGEIADAAAARARRGRPNRRGSPRRGAGAAESAIDVDVGRLVGPPEEVVEGARGRAGAGRAAILSLFSATWCRLRSTAVMRGRIGGEIAHDVAAARGDGDQPVVGSERQRLHVDLGVFPDLGIDEAAEGEGKEPVLNTAQGQQAVMLDGLPYMRLRRNSRFDRAQIRHPSTSDSGNSELRHWLSRIRLGHDDGMTDVFERCWSGGEVAAPRAVLGVLVPEAETVYCSSGWTPKRQRGTGSVANVCHRQAIQWIHS